MILTFRFRIKDSSAKRHLRRHSRAVNFVWNYCCGVQREAQRLHRKWPSHFELTKLCTGASAELGINANTIGEVCRHFAAARNAKRRCPKFRSYRKSLGWLPFRGSDVQLSDGAIRYRKRVYRYWASRGLGGKVKTGSFCQDARGRWYVNFQCEVAEQPLGNTARIGIDLGLKELAVCSDGTRIENPRFSRVYETKLATAQRAGNKRRAQAIHAKIGNARRHFLHEQSTRLARQFGLIVVGDVNAASMKQTSMAKSVSDASWSTFRTMLRYKAIRHGAAFIEADERWTSATCSDCGAVSGPKGRKGLRIREWVCSSCGSVHDRDKNAAANILALGAERRPPVAEILAA